MSDTDHCRMPGTHRVWARADRYDLDWDDEMLPRRVKSVPAKRVAIEEGVAEYREAGLPWWDRSIGIERRRQRLDDLSNYLLADLARMTPAQRRLLERDGHTNHLLQSA